MRPPFDLGYLEHTLSFQGVKNVKVIVGKIVEAFSKASLPFDVNDVVGLIRNTDWSDLTVVAFNFIVATFTILVSPYIILLLASPRQTILILHFWRRARQTGGKTNMAKFWKEFEVNCPDCLDHSVVKAGQRNGYQRYRCKACRKHFRADGQAKRRRNTYTAEMIGATIRDYYAGLSIKQLAESIADRYDVPEPSKATIYRWISAYTDKAKVATKDVKAEPGDHWVVDELFVRVGGVRGYVWKGHQFKLEPIKESSIGKPLSPKPEMPKSITTPKGHQHSLLDKTVPSFMRRPRPAGAKRH